MNDNKEKNKRKERNQTMKWIDRIVCDIFLGITEILILIGLYYTVKLSHNPPPDVNDLTTIFSLLMPFLFFTQAGIIAGLVYHGAKSIKEIKENKDLLK